MSLLEMFEDTAIPEELHPSTSATPPIGVLFNGDTGVLPYETRRVLTQLLAGPYVDGQRHAKLWPVLVRDEAVLRSRLAELFLDLVLDRDQQVAFTRQADTGELEVPRLLRRSQLTLIDSVLLLYLRQRLTQADTQGDRAVVSVEEMLEYVTIYDRHDNTDRAGFTKKVHAGIEKLKDRSILRKLRDNAARFEISPTLKLLFSAEEIQALTRIYQEMAAGGTAVQASVDEDGDRTP